MKYILPLIPLLLLIGCAEDEEVDIQETAQQIGDVMASVDESGGTSNGTMVMMESHQRFIARREKDIFSAPYSFLNSLGLYPKAQAVACKDTAFTACNGSSQKVRDLSGCTINGATFTGDVTLQFSDAACVLNSNGDTVDREPNFTVTGRRGAVLTVSKVGNGQRITRGATASDFTFSNDGIRRVFTLASRTLFDYTTSTTSDITVTGSSRSDRVMTGGQLRVTNNDSGVSCNYAPSNVTWTSSCNCATSGSWAGTCSDGKTTSVVITGCGTGSITIGEDTEALSFDRCYSTN
jgi:hypothetical protein